MDEKQLASGFGLLSALTALRLALVARETNRGAVLSRKKPVARRPAPAMFGMVAGCAVAGWLSTSLLVSGMPRPTWLAAVAGLLVCGCAALFPRWRFEAAVPLALSGAAFVAFTCAI